VTLIQAVMKIIDKARLDL